MKKYLPLFFILLFALALRVPSLFEPYWHGDEGIRLAMGQALFSGKVLYRDLFDNSPPLLYVIFGAGGNLLGVKSILALWVITTTAIFFLLARLIEKSFRVKNTLYPILATLTFVFLTSTPFLEGNIANGEVFFILPTVAAMYLLYETQLVKVTPTIFLLIGFLFSLSTLMKVPAVTDFGAALAFLGFVSQGKELFKKLSLMICGFTLPWIIVVGFFLGNGSFGYFVEAILLTTISYVNYTNQLFVPQGATILKSLAALVFAFFVFLKRKNLGKHLSFLLLWFVFSLLGALLGGRNFNHYLIQAAAPLALLLTLPIMKKGRLILFSAVFTFTVFALVFYFGGFRKERIVSYYLNFASYTAGAKTTQEYWEWFDQKTPRNYHISEFLQTKLKNGECIFVFGDEPQIYPLSGLCPTTRFVAAYHLNFAPHFKKEALEVFSKNPPAYVVVIDKVSTNFPELSRFILRNYRPLYRIDDALIWQRRD